MDWLGMTVNPDRASQVVDRSSGETLICVSALFREGTRDTVVSLISVKSASLAAFLWQGHVTGHSKICAPSFIYGISPKYLERLLGVDGNSDRYVVAASPGNTLKSGFCS
ncbi:hypothetical protein YC2023_044937 [Brassica napus]